MIAIDTNVFVYGVDSTDVTKQSAATKLILHCAASGGSVLLWQVAIEVLRWLRRAEDQGKMTKVVVEDTYRNIRKGFRLVLPREPVLDIALDIYRRHSLSHWDSILLAACIDAGIDTLYSEDLSHGAIYDGVTVLNPFVP
jgi:predicted nucleic acid-binding protein